MPNFTPMSRLVHFEFRRFKGLSRLALIFILLIPLLYGGIYLQANWDLYAHIDRVKVAVVNHDVPAKFGDKTVAGGDDFVAALKAEPTFDWQFLGEDDEAAFEGLRSGEYFMVITVPKDFSRNLVSAGDYKPARAVLQLHRDDANGFIIGTLTGKAEDALAKTLDATVSETYFKALFISLNTIKENLTAAAEGAHKLDDGLAQAADGVHQLDAAVTTAVTKTDSLKAHSAKADRALSQMESGINNTADAMQDVRGGAADLAAAGRDVSADLNRAARGVRPIVDFVKQDLPRLQNNAKKLVTASASLTSPNGGTVITLDKDLDAALDARRELLINHPELANDPAFAELTTHLQASAKGTASITTKLDAVANLSAGINLDVNSTGLEAAASDMTGALTDANKHAAAISTSFDKMSRGLDDAGPGIEAMRKGGNSIAEVGRGLAADAPEVISGVVQLSNALGRLDTAMPQLSAGAHTLADGLTKGAGQIPSLSEDQRNNLSHVMASPVDIEQTVDHDAKYYGRGLAPFFFSIALWIACVSTFLVVRTISGRALTGRANPIRIALAGFGPVAFIAVVGALVMGFGVWGLLGLDPVHPWLFTLLLVVSSLSFMALAYWVRLAMGSPQTAVFLIALILQLPASGGTFPVAMLSSFYQWLSYLSPMRYSVDAFRVAISGGSMSTYWGSTGVLMALLIASGLLVLALVYRRQRFRMRDLHPPMVTSTSTADYAFSVRAR